ncbi:phage tail protein [Pasteurella skyensis]|uniref:Phage tail protein n=1 Tax=Phocoenobacter skyensis TaxID=97481 RepID=A0AAJ6NAE1_9PAST|nr:phage tail protein [Pasteurella skyensis]MDP8173141.1 phage tail protein [Pasteurella skyensis]MDP8178926.1 phage tail protein [Pasteurella skyensis]
MLQNSAMMSLGYFVFTRSTIPYQSTSRDLKWRHPTNSIVGNLPRTQFTGKESETITISGTLMPEITGGDLSIKQLELMAEKGTPYPLIDGSNFMIIGWFVIESIQHSGSFFFGDGKARKIEFSMTLKRTDDSILSDIVDDVMSYL